MKVSEDKIQTDCYIWFHNNHPELRGLLCYKFTERPRGYGVLLQW